jgi:hypothetical protein
VSTIILFLIEDPHGRQRGIFDYQKRLFCPYLLSQIKATVNAFAKPWGVGGWLKKPLIATEQKAPIATEQKAPIANRRQLTK